MNLRAETSETHGEEGVESTRRRLDTSPDVRDLQRLLGDDELTAAASEVRQLLRHALFQRRDGLDTTQAAALAYRRARFLSQSLGLGSGDLRGNSIRLFAVHEWLGLLDGVATTVVMARLMSLGADCGVFPFVVRLRDERGAPCPFVRIAALSEKPGYALDNGVTLFDGVRVPKHLLLSGSDSVLHADGRFESRIPSRRGRFLASMARVQVGRVCFTSAVVAMLRAATWIALRYTSQRLTSAPGARSVPTLGYRNVQRDIFGALASAYALTFAIRRVQRAYREREGLDQQELFRLVAALKAVASNEVSLELQRLRERCGAAGMLSANRIIDYSNQVQGVITAEGDNHLMLLKVGRQIWEMAAPEAPPQPSPLRDLGSASAGQLLSLFRFREARVAEALRASVSDTRARTRSAFSIWNDNVNATMAAANSYGLRVIAESFCVAVEAADQPDVSAALLELFRLWCAEQLERSAGWFLAHGCLEPGTVIELSRARDEQCARIEKHGRWLSDAFGFDNSILQAPIADEDYTQRYDSFFRDRAGGL
jgi:acyl-CoA oxidase